MKTRNLQMVGNNVWLSPAHLSNEPECYYLMKTINQALDLGFVLEILMQELQ